MLVRESISFQRYKDPKEALGLTPDDYNKEIIENYWKFSLSISGSIMPKRIFTDINYIFSMIMHHDMNINEAIDIFLKTTYNADKRKIKILNKLKEIGIILPKNLLKLTESISFQRYKDPKEALGLQLSEPEIVLFATLEVAGDDKLWYNYEGCLSLSLNDLDKLKDKIKEKIPNFRLSKKYTTTISDRFGPYSVIDYKKILKLIFNDYFYFDDVDFVKGDKTIAIMTEDMTFKQLMDKVFKKLNYNES